MITLITYLTWPKHMTFHGLSYKTLDEIAKYISGPDYTTTILMDIAIAYIIISIFVLIRISKSSSKEKP